MSHQVTRIGLAFAPHGVASFSVSPAMTDMPDTCVPGVPWIAR